MRTGPPTTRLGALAAEATRLAQDVRTLERDVTAALDEHAAWAAQYAALRLDDLAGLLAGRDR